MFHNKYTFKKDKHIERYGDRHSKYGILVHISAKIKARLFVITEHELQIIRHWPIYNFSFHSLCVHMQFRLLKLWNSKVWSKYFYLLDIKTNMTYRSSNLITQFKNIASVQPPSQLQNKLIPGLTQIHDSTQKIRKKKENIPQHTHYNCMLSSVSDSSTWTAWLVLRPHVHWSVTASSGSNDAFACDGQSACGGSETGKVFHRTQVIWFLHFHNGVTN